jgi:hypothetical protein
MVKDGGGVPPLLAARCDTDGDGETAAATAAVGLSLLSDLGEEIQSATAW